MHMNDIEFGDFMSALGEEFCEALSPVVGFSAIAPNDAYELFIRAFATDPSPHFLASLSDSQLELLRVECEKYFERKGFTVDQLRKAVRRTLWRWPSNSSE
jgi:hypothetical protein